MRPGLRLLLPVHQLRGQERRAGDQLRLLLSVAGGATPWRLFLCHSITSSFGNHGSFMTARGMP